MNRPSRDRVVHILADFITRPTAARKRGDLAQDHIDVAKALRDLVDVAAARAADAIDERQRQREQQRLADLYEARAESTPDERALRDDATIEHLRIERDAAIEDRDAARAGRDNLAKLLATRDRDYHDAVNECERARKERDSALEKLGRWRNQFALPEETDDQAIASTVDVARKAHEDIVQARKERDVAIAERNAAADLLSLIARQCWPDESGPFRPEALAKIPDRVRALRLIYEDRTKQ